MRQYKYKDESDEQEWVETSTITTFLKRLASW